MDAAYIMAFTTGILGGFGHCIGMCGPLVASYTLADRTTAGSVSALGPHLLYNTGRILTYTFMGGVMGLTGSFVNVAAGLAGIQNAIAVAAGVMMIIMGMNISGIWGSTRWIEKNNLRVLLSAQRVRTSKFRLRFLLLGLVLGFLPCGLSYTIFIAAAATGSPLSGMVTSLLFGLGTLPALVIFGALVSALSSGIRTRIYRAGGVLVIVMGIYFLYKGIKLYASV